MNSNPHQHLIKVTARLLVVFAFVAALLSAPFFVQANAPKPGSDKPLVFILDWVFTGAHAPYVMAKDGGYFKKEGLAVSVEKSLGAKDAVEKVATRLADFGLADMSAVIAHNARNPQNPLTAFYLVNDQSPLSVISLSESSIRSAKDLEGKRIGAPTTDVARQMFALFANAAAVDASRIQWVDVEPQLRESRLLMGEVDAITGFFTTAHFLELQGVAAERIKVIKFSDVGVNLYSLALFARTDTLQANPAMAQAFARAVNQAIKDTIAKPETALAYLPAYMGRRFKAAIEKKRLQITIDQLIATPFIRQQGLSVVDRQRLARNMADITAALKLPPLSKSAAWATFSDVYLPPLPERQLPPMAP